jgi:hypothetical protein
MVSQAKTTQIEALSACSIKACVVTRPWNRASTLAIP